MVIKNTPDLSDWTTELVPIESLKSYVGAPRTHTPEQMKKLIASYREFGWTSPLLIDEDGVIIAGEARRLLAEAVGLDAIPCKRMVGLSDAQKRALRIADNRIPLDAGWDDEKLRVELEFLRSADFDLKITGFDTDELSALLADRPPGEPDATPPLPEAAVSMLGDIWDCGDHVLVCGDSTASETVRALLGDDKPGLMVTDAPYGVSYDPQWREEHGNKTAGKSVILNDDRADWGAAWALFPGRVCYVWHAGLFAGPVQDSLLKYGFAMRAQIVWVKTQHPLSRGNYHWRHEAAWMGERMGTASAARRLLQEAIRRAEGGASLDGRWLDEASQAVADADDPVYAADHETAAYAVKGTAGWSGDRRQTTVWEISHLRSGTGHGSQKPVECMKRPIENNSRAGDLVYDPFLGSGTTMIACEASRRACRAVELNPQFVDVSVARWEMFSGKTAIHRQTGKTLDQLASDRGVAPPKRIAMQEKTP